jgi:hypothetical protein
MVAAIRDRPASRLYHECHGDGDERARHGAADPGTSSAAPGSGGEARADGLSDGPSGAQALPGGSTATALAACCSSALLGAEAVARLDPDFVHGVEHAHDVVGEHLAQSLFICPTSLRARSESPNFSTASTLAWERYASVAPERRPLLAIGRKYRALRRARLGRINEP